MSIIDTRDITELVGSEWTLPPGFSVIARMVWDNETRPDFYGVGDTDDDPYTTDQDKAWRDDRWWYVGLIVSVYAPGGIELAEDACFGFEFGMFPTREGSSIDLDPLHDDDFLGGVMHQAMFAAQVALDGLQGRLITRV